MSPLNNLDPQVYLYDGNNDLLGTDDNSAADQRNATLTYTFADPGQYTVRVSAVGATGRRVCSQRIQRAARRLQPRRRRRLR